MRRKRVNQGAALSAFQIGISGNITWIHPYRAKRRQLEYKFAGIFNSITVEV